MSFKRLVLLVDDDAELLQHEGWAAHGVLTGGDGERALQALQPDVVLPDTSGYELCRRWRPGGRCRASGHGLRAAGDLRHLVPCRAQPRGGAPGGRAPGAGRRRCMRCRPAKHRMPA
jgi:hypothetical protein